jgi:hypothetical protein
MLPVLFLAGCDDGGKRTILREAAAQKDASVALEEIFNGKTAKSTPARVYKITLQPAYGSEHLLVVLGDPGMAVSMPKSSLIKIGDKELSNNLLYVGGGITFVAKPPYSELRLLATQPASRSEKTSSGESCAVTSQRLLENFAKKVHGNTLNWNDVEVQ